MPHAPVAVRLATASFKNLEVWSLYDQLGFVAARHDPADLTCHSYAEKGVAQLADGASRSQREILLRDVHAYLQLVWRLTRPDAQLLVVGAEGGGDPIKIVWCQRLDRLKVQVHDEGLHVTSVLHRMIL
ncbi:hypothetical protein [Actinopolymorpha sp. B9G3]|uniref:hypothetical protein n=1 Tax=Actinopolymorpha sp. B9G3 TaxID=3158970 RepID=UPI0032D9A654